MLVVQSGEWVQFEPVQEDPEGPRFECRQCQHFRAQGKSGYCAAKVISVPDFFDGLDIRTEHPVREPLAAACDDLLLDGVDEF
jgi:hypothetical protein